MATANNTNVNCLRCLIAIVIVWCLALKCGNVTVMSLLNIISTYSISILMLCTLHLMYIDTIWEKKIDQSNSCIVRHFIQAVLCSAKIKTQQVSICWPWNVGFLPTGGVKKGVIRLPLEINHYRLQCLRKNKVARIQFSAKYFTIS